VINDVNSSAQDIPSFQRPVYPEDALYSLTHRRYIYQDKRMIVIDVFS
jgi:hypothetical protein